VVLGDLSCALPLEDLCYGCVVFPSFFILVADAVTVAVAAAVTSCASFVVCYLALVMRLSCASSMVLLSCLPSLGFDKKKISICYQGFFIIGLLL